MTGRVLQRGLGYTLACLMAAPVLAAGGSGGAVQEAGKPSPVSGQATEARDLSLMEAIQFPIAPPTAMLGETKCDAEGDLYVVETALPPSLLMSGVLSKLPILKLSIGSKSTTVYPVPTLDGYRGVIRSDFDVSADGNLYALLQALDSSSDSKAPPSSFVAKYHDNGSLDSYFKLGDPPEGRLQPFRIAMFKNGNVLVAGTAVNQGDTLRPFTAVFDGSGKFITYVKTSDTLSVVPNAFDGPQTEHQAAPKRPAQAEKPELDRAISLSSSSFIVSAPDGNIYLLRDAAHPHLYAVSPDGNVQREFNIPVPAPGLTASNMAVAGTYSIFISFGYVYGTSTGPASSGGPNYLISVINLLTGEVSAVYRLPADADGFNVPACAVSSDNFLFVGSTTDNQHQLVRKYAPR